MKSALRSIAPFALYLLIACAMVAPVFQGFSTRLVGNAEHPGLHGEMFHLRDFTENVRAGRFLQPFRSERVAYPDGEDLRSYVGISLHLFFYLPLLWLREPASMYNALILLTLALNGWTAFLLGRHLAKSFLPAFLCGLLFLLSPYALLKLDMGFVQKTILWWIPLFLLYLLRFLDERRARDAFLAGIFWSLMLLTYAPYAVYAVWAAIALALCRVVRRPADLRPLLRGSWALAAPALVAVILLAVNLPGGGFSHDGGGDELPWAISDAPRGCLDIFRPFRFFPYGDFIVMVRDLPLGLSALGILLALVALARRQRFAGSLAVMSGLFLLISIGPYLHTDGRIVSGTPLPYYFLARYMPGGERLGFAMRALPFFEIGVCAMAALALAGAGGEKKWRRGTLAAAILLPLLVVGERAAVLPELFPPRITATQASPEMNWLKRNGGVVIHIPFSVTGWDCRRYIYTSAMTGTRMVNYYMDAPGDAPFPPLPDPSPAEMAAYLRTLRALGCELIVVHPPLLDESSESAVPPGPNAREEVFTLEDTKVFRAWCGHPAVQGREMIVYRLPPDSLIDWRERQLAREGTALPDDVLQKEVFPNVRVSDEDARAYFRDHPAEFRRPRQIRIHQFYVPFPPGGTRAEKEAARREAQELRRAIKSGPNGSFELADKLLKRDGAQRRWGDIGYFSRGTFPRRIEDALFGMETIGDTVIAEGDDGFHVCRLMDVRPGKHFTYEEVRQAALERALRKARAEAARVYERQLIESRHDRPADDMVFIPGGTFWMGSNEEEIDRACHMASNFVGRTRPVEREWFEDEAFQEVRVDPFHIDRHEVTIGDYRRFLAATGHRPLPGFVDEAAPGADYPAVGVSFGDAQAYAKWVGKRLPTAEEWEWAARGPARRWFPWGDGWPDGSRANYADAGTDVEWRDLHNDDGHSGLAPVGTYPAGATPEGVLDMAGNAREWTATERQGIIDPDDSHIWDYREWTRLRGTTDIPPVPMIGVRGGAWQNAADDMRCSDERILPPDTRIPSQGFRCVRDAGAPSNQDRSHE